MHGLRGISPDTSLRLAKFFGMSDTFWLNLQNLYDLEIEKDKLSPILGKINTFKQGGMNASISY